MMIGWRKFPSAENKVPLSCVIVPILGGASRRVVEDIYSVRVGKPQGSRPSTMRCGVKEP